MEEFLFWGYLTRHVFFAILSLSCFYSLQPVNNRLVKSPGLLPQYLILLLVIYLLAYSPIGYGLGSDKENYANGFLSFKNNIFDLDTIKSDKLFSIYQYITSFFLDVEDFFILTAFIYVYNHYRFAKNIIPQYTFFIFLSFIVSFSFVGYGVNTIRAGLAASFLLLGLSYFQDKKKLILFLIIGIGIHFSMIIPTIAILVSLFYDRTKLYFYLWLLSIPLSFLFGGTFEVLLSGLSSDDRTSYLTTTDTYYNIGFRIDFIIYSCIPIFMGYYFIYKKRFKDNFYSLLLNTYLLSNLFWILVIRANFSDRFAYLSWFLYPIVLGYPFFKTRIWKAQYQKITLMIFLQGLFTYILFLKG